MKDVALFVSACIREKWNEKYTTLFIKYLETAFLKAKYFSQYDLVPGQSGAIAK